MSISSESKLLMIEIFAPSLSTAKYDFHAALYYTHSCKRLVQLMQHAEWMHAELSQTKQLDAHKLPPQLAAIISNISPMFPPDEPETTNNKGPTSLQVRHVYIDAGARASFIGLVVCLVRVRVCSADCFLCQC